MSKLSPEDYIIVNLLPYLKSKPNKACSTKKLIELAQLKESEFTNALSTITKEQLAALSISSHINHGCLMLIYSKPVDRSNVATHRSHPSKQPTKWSM